MDELRTFKVKEIDEMSACLIDENGLEFYTSNWADCKEELKTIAANWEELYVELEKVWGPTPHGDLTVVDLETVRESVRAQIKKACHDKIVEGITVNCGLTNPDGTNRGELHYTLSEKNQQDMRDLATMIAAGSTAVTWRDDSRVAHEIYTAEQFMVLYQAGTQYILSCRFKSDALEVMLNMCTTVEEMESITWDSEIPPEIQEQMQALWDVMYPEYK